MSAAAGHVRSGASGPPDGGGAALLVHGGAWAIPDDETSAHRRGLLAALERGRSLLLDGAAALDVVAETVAMLEADGTFDAGRGAVLDRDGHVQLDAGLMDGATLAWGAVANVRRVAAPIQVARRLVEGEGGQARLLVGAGAEVFAAEQGFELVENSSLVHPREEARFEGRVDLHGFHTSRTFSGVRPPPESPPASPTGTVGCVARDRAGRLAAATSTGGAPFARPGRVGDSPLVGSGFYADLGGAASATGWGEAIASVLLCGRAVDALAAGGTPEEEARVGVGRMYERVQNPAGEGATGGVIVMDAAGRGGWAFTTPRMARGGWREGAEPWAEV